MTSHLTSIREHRVEHALDRPLAVFAIKQHICFHVLVTMLPSKILNFTVYMSALSFTTLGCTPMHATHPLRSYGRATLAALSWFRAGPVTYCTDQGKTDAESCTKCALITNESPPPALHHDLLVGRLVQYVVLMNFRAKAHHVSFFHQPPDR